MADTPVPPDDPARRLTVARPDEDRGLPHIGQPVATRTEAPPPLSPDEQAAFVAKSTRLAPQFKTELLPPPGHGR